MPSGINRYVPNCCPIAGGSTTTFSEVDCVNCAVDETPLEYDCTLRGSLTDGTCTDCTDIIDLAVRVTQSSACEFFGSYVGASCTYDYILTINATLFSLIIQVDAVSAVEYRGTHGGDCDQSLSLAEFTSFDDECNDWNLTTMDIAPV